MKAMSALCALAGGLLVVIAAGVDVLIGGTPGLGTVQIAGLGVGLALLAAAYGLARRPAGRLTLADVPWIVGTIAIAGGGALLAFDQATAPPPPDLSHNQRLLMVERSVRPPGRGSERCLPPAERQFPTLRLEPVASGFEKPVYVTTSGDGSERLFVVEKTGRIRIARAGGASAPFLDIYDRVSSDARPGTDWEQGLLSVAFPPDFASSGRFYVHYTALPDGEIRLSRFHVGTDSDRADPDSEEILLALSSAGPIHNGGQLQFGPDGMLYMSLGDGGGHMWPHGDPEVYGSGAVEYRDEGGGPIIPRESGYTGEDIELDDPWNQAQDRSSLFGSILRIDVSVDSGYAIPTDNPFDDDEERLSRRGRSEIWAYGLRNPWRFSFDSCDGALFAGDVGRSSYEEIDLIVKGGNYGWDVMEGGHCNPPWGPQTCSSAGLEYPISTYGHPHVEPSGGHAVTGGYVYRGTQIPALVGRYLFADFISSRIWALTPEGVRSPVWHSDELMTVDWRISSFGVDAEGEILIVDYGGAVYRLVADRDP